MTVPSATAEVTLIACAHSQTVMSGQLTVNKVNDRQKLRSMVNKLTVTFDHTLNLRVGKSLTVIDSHLTVDFDFAKTIDCCDYSAKMVADVPVMFLHNSVSYKTPHPS